jgi:hypothetical protein
VTGPLFDFNTRTETFDIDDNAIVKALYQQVLEGLGLWDAAAGRAVKGVTVRALREGGRAGQGGYRITVTRNLAAMDQARLPAPTTHGGAP